MSAMLPLWRNIDFTALCERRGLTKVAAWSRRCCSGRRSRDERGWKRWRAGGGICRVRVAGRRHVL